MHYFIEELYSNILINTNNYKKQTVLHSFLQGSVASSFPTNLYRPGIRISVTVALSLLTVARLRLSTLLIGTATG
jgi:hypothetical protein